MAATETPLEAVIWDEKVLTPAKVWDWVSTTPATVLEATETARVMLSGLGPVAKVQVVPATVPEAATSRKLASVAAEELTEIWS